MLLTVWLTRRALAGHEGPWCSAEHNLGDPGHIGETLSLRATHELTHEETA